MLSHGSTKLLCLTALLGALLLCAADLGATPLKMEYSISGSSAPYTYNFLLTLDNHDSSWAAGQSQGFGMLVFGDSATASPLTNFTMAPYFAVGPWTSVAPFNVTSGGNTWDGWAFWSVIDEWIPQQVGDSLFWTGTSTDYVGAGQMQFSTLYGSSTPASHEPATLVSSVAGMLLTLQPTVSAVQQVYADEQGAGSAGLQVGKFTLTNNGDAAGDMAGITIRANGTGVDDTAHTMVAIHLDHAASGTVGSFDAGDPVYGTAASAYPAENGYLTFTQSLNFQIAQTRTFFVVIKLGGTPLPLPGQDFQTRIMEVTLAGSGMVASTGPIPPTGIGLAQFDGVVIKLPAMAFADTSPALATVAPGAVNAVLGSFSVTVTDSIAQNFTRVTVALAVSAPGTTADITRLAIYSDLNSNNVIDGADALLGSTTTISLSQDINLTGASTAKAPPAAAYQYIVAANVAASAPNTAAFNCHITSSRFSYAYFFWLPTGQPTISSSGIVIATTPTPEMEVERAATTIFHNGTDPVSGTAFVALVLDYTIRNTGTAPLTITLNVPNPGSQANCAATITVQPTANVGAGGSTALQVTLTPASAAPFSCVVSVGNNDSDESPYIWTIDGTTGPLPQPEMAVSRSGSGVTDGLTDSIAAAVPIASFTLTYGIANTGAGSLNLSNVAPPGSQFNCTAAIVTQPTSPVGPGLATTFEVTIVPTAAGGFSCTISIDNNDSDENPYNWDISGISAAPAPECDVFRGAAVLDGLGDAVGNAQFGAATVYTYTIENNGTDDLTLTLPIAAPLSQFNCVATIVNPPVAAIVAPGGSATFGVEVTPNIGPFSCIVVLSSDDADEATYNWTLSGTGANTPEIELRLAATVIPSGGFQLMGNLPVSDQTPITFTIANLGVAPLTLVGPTPISFANAINCTPALVTPPAGVVAALGTDTFTVSVEPLSVASFSVDILIASDDSDENPYVITLTGSGVAGLSGGSKGKASDGCAAGPANPHPWLPAGIALVAIAYVRLRRRTAQ